MSINISELKSSELTGVAGFIGARFVDGETGLMLASEGGGTRFGLKVTGAANTDIVRAKNANLGRTQIREKRVEGTRKP